MSAEERREVIREAIHRTICDPRSSHDASLGRCSVAADAVAMDLAAGVSVPTEPGAPDHIPWEDAKAAIIAASRPVPAPEPSARLRKFLTNLQRSMGEFRQAAPTPKYRWTPEEYDAALSAWLTGIDAALAATPQDPEETL